MTIHELKERIKDIPTTIVGIGIIALAAYDFFERDATLKDTVETIIIGAGFILVPKYTQHTLQKELKPNPKDGETP